MDIQQGMLDLLQRAVARDRLANVISVLATPDDLRHRWADGTTRLVYDPIELLERLAALAPRPRINLLLYYGVLGARSAWRARIAGPEVKRSAETTGTPAAPRVAAPVRARENRLWAELMQRSFGFDVLACPRCGGRLELIALIEDAAVTRRILSHLGLPTDVPAARPARPPPLAIGGCDPWYDHDAGVP